MSVTSDQILETLGPRGAIAEAVGILMAKHGIKEDAALDMLVRVSCDADAKVRETAGRIVAVAAGQ
jgi:AmiR/NasT family two-component response regulator